MGWWEQGTNGTRQNPCRSILLVRCRSLVTGGIIIIHVYNPIRLFDVRSGDGIAVSMDQECTYPFKFSYTLLFQLRKALSVVNGWGFMIWEKGEEYGKENIQGYY
jgi:hypothetical protein